MSNIFAVGILQHMGAITNVANYTNNKTFTDDALQLTTRSDFNIEVGQSGAFKYNGLIYLFVCDTNNIIFYVIAKGDNQSRLIRECVNEIKVYYDCSKAFNSTQHSSTQHSKQTQLQLALKKICEKYENPQLFDRITQINEKVYQTKSVMMDNIDVALQNCTKLEDIERGAEELAISAGMFKKNSEALKRQLWWKNMRIKLLIAFCVLAFLAIIIGIAVGVSKQK